MVDSYTGILSALLTRLQALSPVIDIARPGKTYIPVEGVPYQRVHLLPTATQNFTQGDPASILEEHSGLFQISLNYPYGKGAGDALTRAGLIKNHFKRGSTLTAANGVIVRILRTASIGPELPGDAGWFVIPVSVPYFCHIFD